MLNVGKLKGIDDFNLKKIVVRDGFRITARFNDFPSAFHAAKFLMNSRGKGKDDEIRCFF